MTSQQTLASTDCWEDARADQETTRQRTAILRAAASSSREGRVHMRLCWFMPKHSAKRSRIRRLKPRNIKEMPLVKLTPIMLEIHRRELTNRVGRGGVCGGSTASFRCRRIFLMTLPSVIAAMIRSLPCG